MADAMKARPLIKQMGEKIIDDEKVDISWNTSDDDLLFEESQEGQEGQSGSQQLWIAKCSVAEQAQDTGLT